MKQSTSSCLSNFFGDDETEVSEILLNLPNLIYDSESRRRFAAGWGAKRRRSAINLNPSPLRRFLLPSSSSPLPSLRQVENESESRAKVKVEASSPATPLSFSPSESDEKSLKHSRKKASKKRTREEWLEIIEGLIQRRELLRGEIETVKSYHKKLKALNLDLKAKKQELRFSKSLNFGQHIIQSTLVENPQIHCMVLHQHHHQQQQQSYGSHPSENFQYPFGHVSPLMSSGSLLGNVNLKGPLGIPDLNVSAEDTFVMDSSQPLDHNRALTNNRAKAAEARRRRMVRIKEMKCSVAAIKPPRC